MFGRKFNFNFGNSTINCGDTQRRRKNHIDKSETVSSENVKRISVYSPNVDVRIIDSNRSDINAHLHGRAYIGGDISFKAEVVEGELKIKTDSKNIILSDSLTLDIEVPSTLLLSELDVTTSYADVELTGYISVDIINVETSSGDVEINNMYVSKEIFIHTEEGDVEISESTSSGLINMETSSGDIEIRSKKTNDIRVKTEMGDVDIEDASFENIEIEGDCGDIEFSGIVEAKSISITCKDGDVEIGKKTSVESIKIQTTSGDVDTEANFANATINTKKGDVDLAISAERNIDIDISTTKGDISIELHNIGTMMIIPKVPTDRYENSSVYDGGRYSANIKVTTFSGEVCIE